MTVLVSLLGKGIFKLIPILAGLVVGYALALLFGIVNFEPVAQAAWFALPNFTAPEFHWEAILFILPVCYCTSG